MVTTMWCQVAKIGKRLAYGVTVTNETVAIPVSYLEKTIGGLEIGDIIAFTPQIFAHQTPWKHRDGAPKWFARSARLIGEAPQLGNSPAHAGDGAANATAIHA